MGVRAVHSAGDFRRCEGDEKMMTDLQNWLIELGMFVAVSACVWVMGGVADE